MKKLILACTIAALILPAAAQAEGAKMSAEQVGNAASTGINTQQTLVLVVILATVLALISKGAGEPVAMPTTPMPF